MKVRGPKAEMTASWPAQALASVFERGEVAGFALGDAQMVVLELVARGGADEGGDVVAAGEELVHEVRSGEAGGADDEDLHAATISIC